MVAREKSGPPMPLANMRKTASMPLSRHVRLRAQASIAVADWTGRSRVDLAAILRDHGKAESAQMLISTTAPSEKSCRQLFAGLRKLV
jgi:hypothetical protein